MLFKIPFHSFHLFDLLKETADPQLNLLQPDYLNLYVPLDSPPDSMPTLLQLCLIYFTNISYVYNGNIYNFDMDGIDYYRMYLIGHTTKNNGIYVDVFRLDDLLSIGLHPKIKVNGFRLLDFVRKTDSVIGLRCNNVYYKGFLYKYDNEYIQYSSTVFGIPIIEEKISVKNGTIETTNQNIRILQKHIGKVYNDAAYISKPLIYNCKILYDGNLYDTFKNTCYSPFKFHIDIRQILFGFKCVFTNQITEDILKKYPFVFHYDSFVNTFTTGLKKEFIIHFINEYHIVN